MDIVKTKIEELSGTVAIASERGKGTIITIKLPLTLAILPSLMVEIGGDTFAIPMEAVTEIVHVTAERIRAVHGQRMTTVRGRVMPLVRLDEVLHFHQRHEVACAAEDAATENTVVIVGETGQEMGLIVHRVLGEEDVVIKSLAENYRNISGVAGASVLGNGRVALILDIPALLAVLAAKSAQPNTTRTFAHPARRYNHELSASS